MSREETRIRTRSQGPRDAAARAPGASAGASRQMPSSAAPNVQPAISASAMTNTIPSVPRSWKRTAAKALTTQARRDKRPVSASFILDPSSLPRGSEPAEERLSRTRQRAGGEHPFQLTDLRALVFRALHRDLDLPHRDWCRLGLCGD